MKALYSVGTWDVESQGYTPQAGLSVPSLNVPLATLRVVLRELRRMRYDAWRVRREDGSHDSDPWVLVERTDGQPEAEILRRWGRGDAPGGEKDG